ncbi:MAG: nitrile hydratase subunit beta [Beijerinckiaceae bacterium]
MNGAQDFGGQMGFGPVVNELDEPWFHTPWEARALALTLAMGATGTWNIDTSRHARETLPPVVYLASSYYEIWMRGLAKLMVAHGLVTDAELDGGKMLQPPAPVKRVLKAADVPAALAKGGPCDRPCDTPARFQPGDKIRCHKDHVTTHTRLPRYIRGAVGEIVANNGAFVFPDTNAHGKGESPTWCYSVRFDATELWGAGADPTSEVMVDCWEPYLERV